MQGQRAINVKITDYKILFEVSKERLFYTSF